MRVKASMDQLAAVVGKTRQGYYKHRKLAYSRRCHAEVVLEHVRNIRTRQPRVGGKKLHRHLMAEEVVIGRDRLFDLLRSRGLLIRPRRRYVQTTDSKHWFKKYTNLIKDRENIGPGEVIVGDITYLKCRDGFCYLSLLTDVGSHKILGYHVSKSLSSEGCLETLKMALRQIKDPAGMIHHTDRGLQYCSEDYTKKLKKHHINISMTEENHVYENALAERVNGILKDEFLLGECLPSFEIARKMVKQAVEIYNNERLHMSINYMIPAQKFAA